MRYQLRGKCACVRRWRGEDTARYDGGQVICGVSGGYDIVG